MLPAKVVFVPSSCLLIQAAIKNLLETTKVSIPTLAGGKESRELPVESLVASKLQANIQPKCVMPYSLWLQNQVLRCAIASNRARGKLIFHSIDSRCFKW